jgi:hypothetical protein
MNTSMATQDIIARGQELFETIKPRLVGELPSSFLAIDVQSGDYQVSVDDTEAEDRLLIRHPKAVLFVRRVGNAAAHFAGKGYRP